MLKYRLGAFTLFVCLKKISDTSDGIIQNLK